MKKGNDGLIETIKRLSRGDVDIPINLNGTRSENKILFQLEALRKVMQEHENNIAEREKALQMTVSSVAHDLKTPLAIILGYAESIKDGMNDKDYADLIMIKAAEMNKQTLSIMEVMKKDMEAANKKKLIKAKEFLLTEIKKYIPLAQNKNVELVIRKKAEARIVIDQEKISRLLQNIIANAIKYTPEYGRIIINIQKEKLYLKITVKDKGMGIAKTDLPHIFERHFVANKARTDTQSTGLGLFIAKEICEEHGGFLKAKSKLKKGSTFIIYLPLVENSEFSTKKIDSMNRIGKFLLYFFLGFFMTYFYRFHKYSETHKASTLIAALIFVPLFPFSWLADLLNILINNKISFLAE